jgi:hypothetical protein
MAGYLSLVSGTYRNDEILYEPCIYLILGIQFGNRHWPPLSLEGEA